MIKRYVIDVVVDHDNVHQTVISKKFLIFSKLLSYIHTINDEANVIRFIVYDIKTGTSFSIYSCEV